MPHRGQRVLITGAGGYIGSALVQAIAQSEPKCIILLESSEQNLFEIDRQMESAFGPVHRAAVLGNVADAGLLDDIFVRFQPEVVYHAAAFKHVPLLELNPFAAVRNNGIGTYVLAQAAIHHRASQLILVSTDKAVHPHSIMGASKRIAELTIVALSSPACRMNAVRLGNVFGSPGSVVPAFLKQISEGGPVTVTHPDATRWFMSLREAVEAILACGEADCEGRILVPELGGPLRITELAKNLIGSREIPIVFIGLRRGDKLTEKLVGDAEAVEGKAGGLRVIRTRKLSCIALADAMERLGESPAEVVNIVPEYAPA